LVTFDIPQEVDHEKRHDYLKPTGIVYENACGIGVVFAFDKSPDGHGDSECDK
jgi:hypothetical protein